MDFPTCSTKKSPKEKHRCLGKGGTSAVFSRKEVVFCAGWEKTRARRIPYLVESWLLKKVVGGGVVGRRGGEVIHKGCPR